MTGLLQRATSHPRRLLLVSLIVAAGVSMVWLLLPNPLAGPSRSQLEAAALADAAARQELRSLTTTTCFQEAIIDYAWLPAKAWADQQTETNVWLGPIPPELVMPYLTAEGRAAYLAHYAELTANSSSEKSAFVGDIDVAVADLGGKLAAREGDFAWVLVQEADGPVLLKFQGGTTPKGRTLWKVVGHERPMPEGACSD